MRKRFPDALLWKHVYYTNLYNLALTGPVISNDFHVEGLCSRLFPNMFQLKNFVFVA